MRAEPGQVYDGNIFILRASSLHNAYTPAFTCDKRKTLTHGRVVRASEVGYVMHFRSTWPGTYGLVLYGISWVVLGGCKISRGCSGLSVFFFLVSMRF